MVATVISLNDAGAHVSGILTEAIKKGAMNGLYSAALRMVQEIQTVTIPQAVPEPVQRGVYKAGWKAHREADGASYDNPLPYAAIIEFGVRPQNVKVSRKMLLALTEWVKIKGFAKGGDATRMAWAVATAMASSVKTSRGVQAGGGKGIFKGTGLRIMEKANKNLAQFVKEEVAREVERALK